jgi:hypothetical protein
MDTSSFVKSPFAPSLCHQDMYVKWLETRSQSPNTMTMPLLGRNCPGILQAAMIIPYAIVPRTPDDEKGFKNVKFGDQPLRKSERG